MSVFMDRHRGSCLQASRSINFPLIIIFYVYATRNHHMARYFFGGERSLLLAQQAESSAPARKRIPAYDAAIDGAYYTIDIGGQTYSTSEILYSTDYEAYREIGIELSQAQRDDMALR
jgi:hypothetical protein